jgi:hypothetical protein
MHFRNRTEAGIFAFRYLAADVAMGDQSPDENGEASDN